MKAALSDCGTRVVIEGKYWAEDIGIEDLPGRVRLYEWLCMRAGGKYAVHYRDTVAALRAVREKIAEIGGAA